MKLPQRLRILPEQGRRFGLRRTIVFWGTLSFLLSFAMGLVVGKPSEFFGLRFLGVLIAASPLLGFVWLWNRRAVQAGAPEFWTVWKRPLVGLGVGGLAVAAAATIAYRISYRIADRLAQEDWKGTEALIRSEGQPLRVEDLLGPPPTAERNFAEHPLFQGLLEFRKTTDAKGRISHEWLGKSRSRQLRDDLAFPDDKSPVNGEADAPLQRTGTDLVRLSKRLRSYERNQDRPGTGSETEEAAPTDRPFRRPAPPAELPPAESVLFALRAREEILGQVTEAARRPDCRFPLRWEDGLLVSMPHIQVLKDSAKLLRYRASARIATGDPVGAAEDIDTQFRLGRHVVADPSILGLQLRFSFQSGALAGFWEGVSARAWGEPRLAAFQRQFEGHRQKETLVRAIQGEALSGRFTFQRLRSGEQRLADLLLDPSDEADWLYWRLFRAPAPWLLRNQATHAQILSALAKTLAASDPDACLLGKTRHGATHRFEQWHQESMDNGFLPHRIVAERLLPGLFRTFDRSDRLLVATRLAATVCALERHRLAHGAYPESLDTLDTRFVNRPHLDPATGKPFAYRRHADGTIALYSLGPNRKDDGGLLEEKVEGKEPDWVWPPARPTRGRRLF